MENKARLFAAVALCLAAFFFGGCSTASLATAAGFGAAAEVAGDGDPYVTTGATLVGAAVGETLHRKAQSEYDEGYITAQADSIKRLNEARLNMQQQREAYDYEAEKTRREAEAALIELRSELASRAESEEDSEKLGTPVVYRIPGPTSTSDGRKLVPHELDIVVYE